MGRFLLALALTAYLAILLANLLIPMPVRAAETEVVLVELHMDIDAGAEELVRRAFNYVKDRAGSVGAFVLELDTYGGWAHSMDKIIDMVLECPVKTVAFVPEGRKCFSAGAYIFMACEVTAMAPGSAIGSCMPVDAMNNPADQKVINAMAARMRSLADSRGRNATAAEAMVLHNADYTAEEAKAIGITDLLVADRTELLSALGLSGAPLVVFAPDHVIRFFSFVSNPLVQSLLMWVAMWLILIDLFHPTFVMTVIALALLATALWGAGLIGTHPLALTLIILGSALTLIELKKPGLGFEIVGILLILAGVVFAYQFEPFMVMKGFEVALLAIILAGGGVLGYYLYAMRAALARRPAVHEPQRLVGKTGIAKTELRPGQPGVVLVESEEWTAIAEEEIPAGAKVRIISIEGLTLRVEREEL